MSLYITSLNSGSNGNCYYIGNDNEAILVDAGISCREIEKRMKRLGLRMEKIKAVFVSHEHTDHTKGICGLIKKYQLPVYITNTTLLSCGFEGIDNLFIHYQAHERIRIGGLLVIGFPKMHDACDPYSFVVGDEKIKVGVFTDIGLPCKHVINYFKQCHAAFLEANYDDNMLDSGNYPYHLKTRIKSNQGHLSNLQALGLFKDHRPPFLSHLVLSHLSKNNNCPELVKELFASHANGVNIIVASRYEPTEVYRVNEPNTNTKPSRVTAVAGSQLAFSFVY